MKNLNNTISPTHDTLLYWDSTESHKLFGVLSSEASTRIVVLEQIKIFSDVLNTHDGFLQAIAQKDILSNDNISNYEIWRICNNFILLMIVLTIAKTKIQIIQSWDTNCTMAIHIAQQTLEAWIIKCSKTGICYYTSLETMERKCWTNILIGF